MPDDDDNMFDDETVDGVLQDIVGDNDTDGESDQFESLLADKLDGEEEETEEADDTEEGDDETEEEEPADDEEEVDTSWPRVISGRTFNSEADFIRSYEEAQQYILNTSKGEREPLPDVGPGPSLAGDNAHQTDYLNLSDGDRAYIDQTWEKAQQGDLSQLEDLAMRVYNDNGLSGKLGIALSTHIFDTWAESSPANARKAMRMEMAYNLAAIQSREPVADPALDSVRAQHNQETLNRLVTERLPHLDEAGYAELNAWIEAHADEYDFEGQEVSPEQTAANVAFMYSEMLIDHAKNGTKPATAPTAKKRRANKSAATTPVRGEVGADSTDSDDFLTRIINADVGRIGL